LFILLILSYMSSPAETNNYISLQEATKYCVYTQEYLSLRARQGKLKAIKFGRNWVTTKDWLEEYLGKIVEYNNNLKNGKHLQFQLTQEKEDLGRPPENLPIGELKLIPVKSLSFQVSEILHRVIKKIIFSPVVRFGVIYGIALILLITGVALQKDLFKKIIIGISAPIKETVISIKQDEIYSATISGTLDVYQEYFDWLGEIIKKPISKISNSKLILIIGETTKEIWQVVKTGYFIVDNFIKEKLAAATEIVVQIANEIKKLAFGFSEKMARVFIKPVTREGMVVVPSTERDEEVKAKIKAAFSDEVEVKPKDKESGIIVPVFREKKGEDYLYILVPIQSEK